MYLTAWRPDKVSVHRWLRKRSCPDDASAHGLLGSRAPDQTLNYAVQKCSGLYQNERQPYSALPTSGFGVTATISSLTGQQAVSQNYRKPLGGSAFRMTTLRMPTNVKDARLH